MEMSEAMTATAKASVCLFVGVLQLQSCAGIYLVWSSLRGQTDDGRSGNDVVIVVVLALVGGDRARGRARARRVEICCKSPSAAKIHRELIGDRSPPPLVRPFPPPRPRPRRPEGRGQSHDGHRNDAWGEGGEGAGERASRARRLQYWRLFSSSSCCCCCCSSSSSSYTRS